MKNENKIINNNISFRVISQNQKVENDKERIKSKFNFNISRTSTNSSVNKGSSFTTQQNSCLLSDKLSKIKKKIIFQNNKIANMNNRPFSSSKKSNTLNKINFNGVKRMDDNFLNKNKKWTLSNKTYDNFKEKKMIKENNSQNINNNKIINKLNDDIINNITYSNFENYYTDNSSHIFESQKLITQESILKTQNLEEGIRNIILNDNINISKKENSLDIKIQNENEDGTIKDNHFSRSFNNTSFSGSSKTNEINRDILNLKIIDNESNDDKIKIANNNNYIIRNFIGINNNINFNIISNKSRNLNPEEAFVQKLFKSFNISNLDKKRSEVNTLGLLDDEDYNQMGRKKLYNNTYYFIDDIIKNHNNMVFLSFDKFNNLNNKAKYKIFAYTFDNYKNYLNTSKAMRNMIENMLLEKFEKCIKDFNNKYQNILLLDEYHFDIQKFSKQKNVKKKLIKFCLYLKAKVLPNNEYLKKFGDVSFEISYKYKIKSMKNEYNTKTNRTNMSFQSYISKDHLQEEFIQIYKFDLRENKNYPLWICSERDELFNNPSKTGDGNTGVISKILSRNKLFQSHLIYSSPVINVNENDFIVIRIDLIEDNNVVESFSFNEVIVQSVYKSYYHKTSYKPEKKFDNMRDCENEIAINIWHDECVINNFINNIYDKINYNDFILKIKLIFQEYFDIIETKFDISKFIFIRMTMKAKKIGVLKSNEFCNKDIKIVDKNTPLTKECIPINFVNTFSMNKYLEIKKDTIIEFYLIE